MFDDTRTKILKEFSVFLTHDSEPSSELRHFVLTPADEKDNSREKTQSFGVTSLNSWGTT